MVASYNDYRRGDGNCYAAYSFDAGKSWSDTTPPMGFTRGGPYGAAREYWQGGGDTSVAFDTKGNAYLSCQMFMRGQPHDAEPRPVERVLRLPLDRTTTALRGTSRRVPSSSPDVEGGDAPFLDKQLMTVDNHVGSPFQDRVYVTWTTFDVDGSGLHLGGLVERLRGAFQRPGPRQQRQRPLRQHLRVADAAWPMQREPVLAAVHRHRRRAVRGLGELQQRRDRHRQPQPDAARQVDGRRADVQRAGQGRRLLRPAGLRRPTRVGADPGRACVPETGPTTNSIFRATNYPSGAVSPKDPSKIAITYGSYINSTSKESNGCTPAGFSPVGLNTYTGVKTAGACNNKILLSVSTNGGAGLHRRRSRRGPAHAGDGQRRQAGGQRPVLAVGGVQQGRQVRRLLLRPPVRQRRDDRLAGLQPLRLERPVQLRREAGHVVVDAAADPVLGHSSSATTRGSTRSGRRPSDLGGHA